MGSLAVVLVLVTIGVLRFASSTNETLAEIGRERLAALRLAERIASSLEQYLKDVEVAISLQEPQIVWDNSVILDEVRRDLSEINNFKFMQESNAMATLLDSFEGAVTSYVNLSTQKEPANAEQLLLAGKSAASLREDLQKIARSLVAKQNSLFAQRLADIEEAATYGSRLTALVMTALLSTVLIVSWMLLGSILRRVQRLSEHFSTTHDLTNISPLPISSVQDELDHLVDASNRMLQGLHESRQHLVEKEFVDGILRSLHDSVIVVSSQGAVLRANQIAETKLGLSSERTSIVEIAADAHAKSKIMDLLSQLSSGEPRESEIAVADVHGKTLPSKITGGRMATRTGATGHFVLVVSDLTEIKRAQDERRSAEQRLIQASKLASLGTLGAGVAHELNNPLVGVRGFAELIRDSADASPDIRLQAERIFKASQRMQVIIDHLRTFSADSSSRKWDSFEINTVVNDSLILLTKQLTSRQIDVKLELGSTLPLAFGNPNQVESVVQNLIVNASDALQEMPDSHIKEIRIRTSAPHDNLITVTVSDTGVGIPTPIKERIFEPFFTTKDVGKGTGIGLSISLGIVKEHGGTFTVDDLPGGGTAFSFTLPGRVRPTTATKAPVVQPIGELSNSQRRLSVAIVDDEVDVLDILQSMLESVYETVTFNDPKVATKAFEQRPFDLIVTDMRMPGMNGLEVISRVRKAQPTTPVLVITGHAKTEGDVQEALARGASRVIPKPFPTARELIKIIESAYDENRAKEVTGSAVRKSALIIDDSPDISEILSVALAEEFDVRSTTNPVEGMELASSGQFDLVIVDLLMPKLGGERIVEAVSALPSPPAIILMTGLSPTSEEVEAAMKRGATGVIYKPFDLQEAVASIKRATASKRAS